MEVIRGRSRACACVRSTPRCLRCSKETSAAGDSDKGHNKDSKCLLGKGRKSFHSLYLLGIFVADKNDDGVDVDAVETFDGVRSDVKETVAVLHRVIHSNNIHQTPLVLEALNLIKVLNTQ